MRELNQFQQYLVHEFVDDYNDGVMSRRDMMRRVVHITGGVAAAATMLTTLGVKAADAKTEQGRMSLALLAAIHDPRRVIGGVAANDCARPVSPIADNLGRFRHAMALGDQPEEVPVAAGDWIMGMAIPGTKVVRGEVRRDGGITGHSNHS